MNLQAESCGVRRSAPLIEGKRGNPAFTLVELLVVITIIGILAGLITVAAVGALRKARESEIKLEIDQIDAAFEEYKNKTTAYPPNCQIDGIPPSQRPLDELTVFNDLKRHFRQAFPRHQETDELIGALVEFQNRVSGDYPKVLWGGMTAAEAIVFWLGGFSSDPKYPISGEGGPSYRVPRFNDPDNRKLDPIERRKWIFPCDVVRLQPRAPDGYFDESLKRYIEYRDPKGIIRRINFWHYTPRKSQQPYLYFDTSRYPAAIFDNGGNLRSTYDPPAASPRLGQQALYVYAFKRASTSNSHVPIEFVNPGKFQILHCGLDGAWGEDAFERMSAIGLELNGRDPQMLDEYILFPAGPFTGEVADTIVNFTNVTRIEDAQP